MNHHCDVPYANIIFAPLTCSHYICTNCLQYERKHPYSVCPVCEKHGSRELLTNIDQETPQHVDDSSLRYALLKHYEYPPQILLPVGHPLVWRPHDLVTLLDMPARCRRGIVAQTREYTTKSLQ
jgi:hypothetical protein